MARSDLITDLVATGMAGDRTKFKKVVEALIAEERAKHHVVLAEIVRNFVTVTLFASPSCDTPLT